MLSDLWLVASSPYLLQARKLVEGAHDSQHLPAAPLRNLHLQAVNPHETVCKKMGVNGCSALAFARASQRVQRYRGRDQDGTSQSAIAACMRLPVCTCCQLAVPDPEEC